MTRVAHSFILLITTLAFVFPTWARAAAPASQPAQIHHVLLIGLDGARADAVRDHAGPVLRTLIQQGTVCWNAQAVKPSVTQVNWPSMLTGCMPAKHGIDRHPIEQDELLGMRLKVPTVFDVVATHGGTAVGFLGHWKLYSLESATARAHFEHSSADANAGSKAAAAYIEKQRPTFCFAYIGNLDGLGHTHGWMSPQYLAGMADVDRGVRILLDAVDRADLRKDTLILVTSDHGGHGRAHAEGTAEDTTIPWIAVGPGVPAGRVIERPFSTIDTASTILKALNVAQPAQWDGRPVSEIFEGRPTTQP